MVQVFFGQYEPLLATPPLPKKYPSLFGRCCSIIITNVIHIQLSMSSKSNFSHLCQSGWPRPTSLTPWESSTPKPVLMVLTITLPLCVVSHICCGWSLTHRNCFHFFFFEFPNPRTLDLRWEVCCSSACSTRVIVIVVIVIISVIIIVIIIVILIGIIIVEQQWEVCLSSACSTPERIGLDSFNRGLATR